MTYQTNHTLDAFARSVASDSFAPGGGCVSGYSGALAASLGHMVLKLTIGKKKYAEFDQPNGFLKKAFEKAINELLECVNRDMRGCDVILEAMALPRETDDQKAA